MRSRKGFYLGFLGFIAIAGGLFPAFRQGLPFSRNHLVLYPESIEVLTGTGDTYTLLTKKYVRQQYIDALRIQDATLTSSIAVANAARFWASDAGSKIVVVFSVPNDAKLDVIKSRLGSVLRSGKCTLCSSSIRIEHGNKNVVHVARAAADWLWQRYRTPYDGGSLGIKRGSKVTITIITQVPEKGLALELDTLYLDLVVKNPGFDRQTSTCGNKIVEAGEECDSGEGCLSTCACDAANGYAPSVPRSLRCAKKPVALGFETRVDPYPSAGSAIRLRSSGKKASTCSFTVHSMPENGVLQGVAPIMTYVPKAGFLGQDSFTYSAEDPLVETPSAPVTVTINVAQADNLRPQTRTAGVSAADQHIIVTPTSVGTISGKSSYSDVGIGAVAVEDASVTAADTWAQYVEFENAAGGLEVLFTFEVPAVQGKLYHGASVRATFASDALPFMNGSFYLKDGPNWTFASGYESFGYVDPAYDWKWISTVSPTIVRTDQVVTETVRFFAPQTTPGLFLDLDYIALDMVFREPDGSLPLPVNSPPAVIADPVDLGTVPLGVPAVFDLRQHVVDVDTVVLKFVCGAETPTWLQCGVNGQLSGTPNLSQTSVFTFVVSDALSTVTGRAQIVVVGDAPPPPEPSPDAGGASTVLVLNASSVEVKLGTSSSGGVSLETLRTRDLSGSADVWENYLEFANSKAGTDVSFDFVVPQGFSVESAKMKINFRGDPLPYMNISTSIAAGVGPGHMNLWDDAQYNEALDWTWRYHETQAVKWPVLTPDNRIWVRFVAAEVDSKLAWQIDYFVLEVTLLPLNGYVPPTFKSALTEIGTSRAGVPFTADLSQYVNYSGSKSMLEYTCGPGMPAFLTCAPTGLLGGTAPDGLCSSTFAVTVTDAAGSATTAAKLNCVGADGTLCGNGVLEGSEECDGTVGCTACVCDTGYSPRIVPNPECLPLPVAAGLTFTVQSGGVVVFMLLGTSSSLAPLIDYKIVTAPKSGTLTGTGQSRTYTPNKDFVGVDVFEYSVTDGDAVKPSSPAVVVMNVTAIPPAPPVVAAPIALPPGTCGVWFSASLAQYVTDPIGLQFTCAAAGAVPAGLVLHPNCTLNGVPAAGGSFKIAFDVKNTAALVSQGSADASFTYLPPVVQTGIVLPQCLAGKLYGVDMAQYYKDVAGLVCTVTVKSVLPVGLVMEATGKLSGITLSPAKDLPVLFDVTNSAGLTTPGEAKLTVVGDAPQRNNVPGAMPTGYVGVFYQYDFAILYSDPWNLGLSYALAPLAVLPAGLVLHPNGTLNGVVAKAADVVVDYMVTNTAGMSVKGRGDAKFVHQSPVIASLVVDLPDCTAGERFSYDLSQHYSDPRKLPLVCSSKVLPPGLVLHANGTLNGVATKAGAYNIAYQVKNTAQLSATGTAILKVVNRAPVVPASVVLPNVTAGVWYGVDLRKYYWDPLNLTTQVNTATVLPAGLEFRGNGTINGVTMAPPQTVVVDYSVTNSALLTSNGTAKLHVNHRPPNISASIVLPNCSIGLLYQVNLTNYFKDPLKTVVTTKTVLPPGLTLLSNGTIRGVALAVAHVVVEFTVTNQYGLASVGKANLSVVHPAREVQSTILLVCPTLAELSCDMAVKILESFETRYETFVTTDGAIRTHDGFGLKAGNNTGLYSAIVMTSSLVYFGASWQPSITLAELDEIKAYAKEFRARIVYLYSEPFGVPGMAHKIEVAPADFRLTLSAYAKPYAVSYNREMSEPTWTTVMQHPSLNGIQKVKLGTITDSAVAQPFFLFNGDVAAAAITNETLAQELHIFFPQNEFVYPCSAIGAIWFHWLTHGVYQGHRRARLLLQVDDYLMPGWVWDIASHANDVSEASSFVTSVTDMQHVVAWQDRFVARLPPGSTFKLSMAFNFEGVFTGYDSCESNPLCLWSMTNLDKFFWLSHTYSHANLNYAPGTMEYAQVYEEYEKNLQYFEPYLPKPDYENWSPHATVTPEISGLFSGESLQAMYDIGITSTVGDNSRKELWPLNPYHALLTTLDTNGFDGMMIIPRAALDIYYNVMTREQNVDEYNIIYTSTGFPEAAVQTWDQLLKRTALYHVRKLFMNRGDPYMFHQTNLMAYPVGAETKCLLCEFADAMMDIYLGVSRLPILTLKQDDLAQKYWERMDRSECHALMSYVVDTVRDEIQAIKIKCQDTSGPGPFDIAVSNMRLDPTNKAVIKTEKYGEDLNTWIRVDKTEKLIPLSPPLSFKHVMRYIPTI